MTRTRAERRAARERLRVDARARAEWEASRLGRSLVCQWGRHEDCKAGEAHCLCECHDPEEQQ